MRSTRIRLDRVEGRRLLKPRRDPFWHRISQGRYIGFRLLKASSIGTWLARDWDEEAKAYVYKPLSDFSALTEKQRFDAAKTASEAWWRHRDRSGGSEVVTVRAACEQYVRKLGIEKSAAAATDAAGRFRRLVFDDALARIELTALKPRHVSGWKERLMTGGMTKSAFNRNATTLRAALNLSHERGDVTSDHAWRVELRKYENADGRRELYLNREDRRALEAHASMEAKPFIRSLTLLPFRPGDVANLKVEHLDAHQRVLKVPTGKTKYRMIPLGAESAAHFIECAKSKLPSAWLVGRAGSGKWSAASWGRAIREAVAAAKLPKMTCAYSLRHAVITDLVTNGLDLFSVAKISGTSIMMVEKHYAHLQGDVTRAALERLNA